MKNYTITVNGTAYNVTVEENGADAPVAAPMPAAAPVKAEAPKPATEASTPSGALKIESPMPGTILDISVSAGDSVKTGDVICILEAMKMENEIVAPQDGTIASIDVNKGDSVEAAQVIATLN